jgi:hypothetical protein
MSNKINFVAIGSTLVGVGLLLLLEKKIKSNNSEKKQKEDEKEQAQIEEDINRERTRLYDDWHANSA